MLDAPAITNTASQPTAVIRLTVPRAEMQAVMGPGLTELREAVAAQGVTPTGPWLTHHVRMHPDVFDFEIAIPVPGAITASGRVAPGELPAATVARAVYHGPFEGLGAA
ncbi:MAG: GyrI-like domain-containing protein [Chloroflexi bacterium]|nr:GyrI-like domain-containing protein [Chloroflexota bacterium]MDA1002523.1 GyrI-like domain-containing protein [Chloroflexota bacterium]